MKRRVANYFLIGIVSLLFSPIFLNALFEIPENTKKVVGGQTYTSVYGSYKLDEEADYYYMYGLISHKKMVISVFEDGEYEDGKYFTFENGIYHDTEATATEVIDARNNMWNEDTNEYKIKQYVDAQENRKFGIFYSNYYVKTADGQCYVDNMDKTAVEGTEYYIFDFDDIELVSDFNSEEAHEYCVKVDCEKYKDVFIKDLTTEQVELITTINNELELEYEEANANINPMVISIKDDYLLVFEISYIDEDTAEEIYEHRIYDFSGNVIDKFNGARTFGYLKEVGLYLIQTETEFNVYDTEFNIVYSELMSNLPVSPETHIYGFDFDKNTAYFDFENGLYMTLTRYVVEEGDNQRFSGKDLTIKFNGDLDLLDEVYVNDNVLDSKNYTKAKGSTIITLSKDYLSSLKDGTYTLKATYTDGGEATSTFIINKALENPSTGDNVVSIIILGSISLMGLLGIGLYLKKKNI